MFQNNTWFLGLFVLVYLFHFALEWFLDLLNLREIERHRNHIPLHFEKVFSPADYQKAIAYTKSKIYFRWAEAVFAAVLLIVFIRADFFEALWNQVAALFPHAVLTRQVVYLLAFGAISYVVNLPFQIYQTFGLEARFGFNQSSVKTFILDQFKGMLLALLIGAPLLYLLFQIIQGLGLQWWWMAWIAWFVFQLVMTLLFPILLLPLFYKLTPLPDGSLKTKIQDLAQKISWKTTGIFTLDGSRRSSHSNAFFTGFGKVKRIFLFDTLMQKLSEDEIAAVVAHEMGHSEKKHVFKGFLISSAMSFVAFAILALMMRWPVFYQSFGVEQAQPSIALVLFSLVIPAFTFLWTPWMNARSRRHEYEADQFSDSLTQRPQELADALLKLSRDNLSNLNPHPWYSFYHYSHPTTQERMTALLNKKS